MAIPIYYSVRNLGARKLTTALTAGGMALVVFVFTAMQMLDAGLITQEDYDAAKAKALGL